MPSADCSYDADEHAPQPGLQDSSHTGQYEQNIIIVGAICCRVIENMRRSLRRGEGGRRARWQETPRSQRHITNPGSMSPWHAWQSIAIRTSGPGISGLSQWQWLGQVQSSYAEAHGIIQERYIQTTQALGQSHPTFPKGTGRWTEYHSARLKHMRSIIRR